MDLFGSARVKGTWMAWILGTVNNLGTIRAYFLAQSSLFILQQLLTTEAYQEVKGVYDY